MIRNRKLVERFESEQIRLHPPDHGENLRIFEALYEEARQLGILPPQDPLEGIEIDLRIARALNVLPSS